MTETTERDTSPAARVIDRISRVLGVISSVGLWLGVAGVVIIILFTALDPTLRHLGLGQLPFTIPISVLCMVAIGSLSMAATQRDGENPEFTLLMRLVPRRIRWIFRIVGLAVATLTLGFVVVATWGAMLTSERTGERTIDTLMMVVWPVRLVLCVGVALLAVECLRSIADLLVRREHADDPADHEFDV